MNEQESEQHEKSSVDAEHERLQKLFQKWEVQHTEEGLHALLEEDDRGKDERHRAGLAINFDASRLWGTLTFLLVALSAWMLWMTRHEVAFWMERGKPPIDAGNLAEKWKAGQHELTLASNTFVHATGLFSTMESEGQARTVDSDGQRDAGVFRFYLCPLYNIVVQTRQPFTPKPQREAWHLELAPELVPLVLEKRAFPSDLANEAEVKGRLLRATDAPYWHRKPILYYARRAGLDPTSLWLFLDGESPTSYAGYVTLWGLAWVTILVSLALFSRSYWRRRIARNIAGESS